ncbi:MAG: HPr family phosphocarrier protein [Alphaproteobacteria bacterium]|nr:HPr family phosphocarrier protein [Alphaproteobacteria bacterium]
MQGDTKTGADELCEIVCLVNKRGLHARAAAKIVYTASLYKADIAIMRGESRAKADSIMGLMLLAAPCGTQIKLCASGEEALDALNALADLVRGGFDEE